MRDLRRVAAACAALLTLAGAFLAAPDSLSQVIAHLADPAAAPGTVPAFKRWVKWFLAGDGYCSPALHAATGPAVGALHIIRRTAAGGVRSRLHPPPRPGVRYSITNIPAYIPAGWHDQHLARFAGLAQEQMLRRAAAIRLGRPRTGRAGGVSGLTRAGDRPEVPPGT
ncbi:MAG: hypothetical protein ACLP8X_23320 [Streptosporangiaceae bacterium]